LGHRGAPRVERENTLGAFAAARAAGADGVELDVRRTLDGVLVVHHDPTLPTGEEIVSLSHAAVIDRDPDLATLAAALELCTGLVVNVEIKNWPTDPDFDPQQTIADDVVAALEGREQIVVSSFNLYTLDRVKHLTPSIEVGILSAGLAPDVARGWVVDAAERGFDGVHPELAMATPELIGQAHELGLAVRVWTVDDPTDAARLTALGVDAIITNDPAAMVRA
jgi:glycerophosphoryl diester phosphodiesterase